MQKKKTYVSPLFESILPQCDIMENEFVTGSKGNSVDNGIGEDDFSKNSSFSFEDDFVDVNNSNLFDE